MSATTRQRPLLGVFLPTGNGGFSISTHPRTTTPTWDYNCRTATFAEAAGFDFLLAGARWTTLGSALDFQGHRFESMTLMTALAAVTERIRLFPTIHTHVYHPIVAARMVNDANRISGGRCGINVVSGWVQSDFTMFGLQQKTPAERLAYNTEWLTLLKQAWREHTLDFEGTYFHVRNGYLEPKPDPMPPICKAGESPQSRELVMREADWLFITLPHDAEELRSRVADMKAEAASLGRQVHILSYAFILCRDTKAEALRVRDQIVAAGDPVAATNMATQRGWGPSAADPEGLKSIMLSLGTRPFIGTPQSIIDELQAYFAAGLDGLLFTFYDYELICIVLLTRLYRASSTVIGKQR